MYICKCISSIIIIVIKSDLLIQNDMLFFIFKNDNPVTVAHIVVVSVLVQQCIKPQQNQDI